MILTFPANTAHLEMLGEFIKSLCAEHSRLMAIELAVTEIVVNAIKHGGASFCIVSVNNEGDLYMVIEDNGKAFNPLDPPTLPLNELREGGYGLAIVQQVTDHMHYERSNNHNKLTLKFRNAPNLGG